MAGFDVEGARKAGYSDAEIVDHLATERKFDAAGARRSGYNDAELLTHLRAPLAPTAPATPERGIGETAARLAGNVGAGFNDRLADVLGAPFDLANRGLRAVGVPIPEGSVSDSIRSGINAVVGEPPVAENTAERFARGAGGGVVDAATVLVPALGVSRAAQAGSLTQRVGTAAAASPGLQVASGVAGGAVGEATDSPLLGAAAAIGAPMGAVAAARIRTPVQNALSPGRQALVQAARDEGIPLSVGQETGSPFIQKVEQRLRQMPQTAERAGAFQQRQSEAFNQAVLRRSGAVADDAGPEVLRAERQRIGGTIGDLANRNSLQVSDDLMSSLATLEDDISRNTLPEVAGLVRERMRQVVSQVGEDGTVPGTFYRQMDSALGKQARETSNGDLRSAIGRLREALRTGMDASITPEDAAAWQQARREYANLMVTNRAMSAAGAGVAEGNISPLALRGAVNQSTGGGYAMGEGDLNQLARLGQSVLRPPTDSGTPAGMSVNALLSGAGGIGNSGMGAIIGGALGSPIVGAMAGAAYGNIAPRVVQSALMNPAMQSYLRNQAVSPETRQALQAWRANALLQQSARAVTD